MTDGLIWTEETFRFMARRCKDLFGTFDHRKPVISRRPQGMSIEKGKESWQIIYNDICSFNKKENRPVPKGPAAVGQQHDWATARNVSSFYKRPNMLRHTVRLTRIFVEEGYFVAGEIQRAEDLVHEVIMSTHRDRQNISVFLRKFKAMLKLRSVEDPYLQQWIDDLENTLK